MDIKNIVKYIETRYQQETIYWIIYELIVMDKNPNEYYSYNYPDDSDTGTISTMDFYEEFVLSYFTNLSFKVTSKLITKYPYLFKDINPKVEDYNNLKELYGFLTI